MSTALQNRNKDPYNRQQPIYVDDRGRQMVNPGLDGDVYSLVLPPVAVGANKVFMDLFNGSTDKNVEIQSIVPVMSGAVAVTGTLAVNIWLTRTSAVGTGGTAATAEGANIANPTVSKLDPASPALPATITMRSGPAGGATAGAVLSFESQFSEETNTAAYFRNNLVKDSARLVIPPNTGIRIVQGTVASAGNLGFVITFAVVRR